MDERTFGIEIEFTSRVSRSELVHELNARFQNVTFNGNHHTATAYTPLGHDFTTWVAGSDGSIRTSSTYPHNIELRSPKLFGKDGLKALKVVCDYLSEIGKTNNSCGLHVHHGMDSKEQATRVGMVWVKIEDLIYNCLPESRKNNGYCARWNDTTRNRDDNQKIDYAFGNRRMGLNLSAWNRYQTIEFRCLEGSVKYNTISNWVMITKGIINLALVKDEHGLISTVDEFKNVLFENVAEVIETTTTTETNTRKRYTNVSTTPTNPTEYGFCVDEYERIRQTNRSTRSPIVDRLNEWIGEGRYTLRELLAKCQNEFPDMSLNSIRTRINTSRTPRYNRLWTHVVVENGIYKFATNATNAQPRTIPVENNNNVNDDDDEIIITTVTKRKVDKSYQIACEWLKHRFTRYHVPVTVDEPVQSETNTLETIGDVNNIYFTDHRRNEVESNVTLSTPSEILRSIEQTREELRNEC